MNTISLKSGNTLQTQEAEFEDSWNLTQAILQEFGSGISASGLASVSTSIKGDFDVGRLAGVVAKIVASKQVYGLLWPCFKPCLLNSAKVTPQIFNDPRMRADFLPCVLEVLKVNVFPFFTGLDLESLVDQALALVSPK